MLFSVDFCIHSLPKKEICTEKSANTARSTECGRVSDFQVWGLYLANVE